MALDLELDPGIQELLAASAVSTKVLAKAMYPERFSLPFAPAIHDPIFEAIDDPTIQKLLIIAPRGSGKSSIVDLALPTRHLLYNISQFPVLVSASQTSAIMQTENLKRELVANPYIKQWFPPVRTKQTETFSKEQWEVNNSLGSLVLPRGAGQQVRGLIHRHSRPDLIIVDDLEDSELVLNEENRKKLKKWFVGDLCNCIDVAKDNWKIIVIGTILHEDCLLSSLADSGEWHTVTLDIMTDEGKSNWPEKITDEKLQKALDDARNIGELTTFYMEHRSSIIPGEDATFHPNYFKYYEEPIDPKINIENIVLVDPAKSISPKADDTAIVGVGIDTDSGMIYVRDVVSRRMYPDETINEMLDMAERLGARAIGVEVNSLNEYITYPLQNEMMRRRVYKELIELKPRGKKLERIRALVPFYRMGQVRHNKACCNELERQLMSFPRSKKDDRMDALAYVVGMLEKGGRFFTGGSFEDTKSLDKEFEELEEMWEEEAEVEAWRGAP